MHNDMIGTIRHILRTTLSQAPACIYAHVKGLLYELLGVANYLHSNVPAV